MVVHDKLGGSQREHLIKLVGQRCSSVCERTGALSEKLTVTLRGSDGQRGREEREMASKRREVNRN